MGDHAWLWSFSCCWKTGRAGLCLQDILGQCLQDPLSVPGAIEKGVTPSGNWGSWDGAQQNLGVWTSVTYHIHRWQAGSYGEKTLMGSDLHPCCPSAHSTGCAHPSGDGGLQAWSLGACSPCQWRRPLGHCWFHPSPWIHQDHLSTPATGLLLIPLPPSSQPRGTSLVSLGPGAEVGWSGLPTMLFPVNAEHKLSIWFPSGLPSLMSRAFPSFNKTPVVWIELLGFQKY